MCTSLEVLYNDTIRTVVRNFIQSLPDHFDNHEPKLSQEVAMSYLDEYGLLWNRKHHQILTAVSADISRYLNYYSVLPKTSIDEFKAVYFTGRVISKILDDEGFSGLREINDYVTIALLDYNLDKYGTGSRCQMTKSLREVARQNHVDEKLGEHGMYLLYKSHGNAAKESTKAA